MCDDTKKKRIQNTKFRKLLNTKRYICVMSIEEKMTKDLLRWFGYV